MAKKLPHNVYIDNLINPDGSHVEGEGKRLNQRIKIDSSKIKQTSPWVTKTPMRNPKLGFSAAELNMGSIPDVRHQPRYMQSGFMNDGVGVKPNPGFTMPAEGAGLPARVDQIPKIGRNHMPDPSIGKMQDTRGLMLAMGLESLVPSTVMADEVEQGLIHDDMRANNYNPKNIPLDYSANPAQEIANLNFNDPLLMEMMKGNSPQPVSQQAAQSVMAQGSASPELAQPQMPYNRSASASMSARAPMGNGNQPIMARGGDLSSMIQNYAQQGQQMNSNRDEELLRLMSMRDSAQNSMSNKSAFDRMNLNPLNAFIDAQFGTKYAQSYDAPETGVDDMNVMNALNDRVSGYTKNKNAEQLALYRTIMDAQNKDEMMDLRLQLSANKPDPFALIAAREAASASRGNFDDAFKVRTAFHKDGGIENLDAGIELTSKLQKFRTALAGAKNLPARMAGGKRAELESLYSQIMTQVNRDDAKLGALAGPDLAILKQQFKDPTGFAGLYNSAVNGGVDAQFKNIDTFINKIGERSRYQLSKASQTYRPLGHANDMIDQYEGIVGKTYGDSGSTAGATVSGKKRRTQAEIDAELLELGL